VSIYSKVIYFKVDFSLFAFSGITLMKIVRNSIFWIHALTDWCEKLCYTPSLQQ